MSPNPLFKTLEDWLNYIESLHPKTIALGLERVQTVAERLQITTFSCPVITVAGTNGKGSCVAFLEAILQAAGYKVGTYTSPHLLRFQERVHIDAQECTAETWAAAFSQIEQARQDIPLTYFEFTTLAALLMFKAAPLDALVLEVGLGGRLDAVNIIDSDIAIITTIALDHQEWLGNTREAIGSEKAGIFRANKPAICGDFAPPDSIFIAANTIEAPLHCLNQHFSFALQTNTWSWKNANTQFTDLPIPHLPIQNAATALMALVCLLPELPVELAAIKKGLSSATLPGRFEQRSVPASLILDVAHNPAAATLLAQRLQERPITGKTLAVVSILADKDITETLRPLIPLVDIWFLAGLPLARGVSATQMANHLHNLGVTAYYMDMSVSLALQHALDTCHRDDRILVYGSFHTVASVSELYGT